VSFAGREQCDGRESWELLLNIKVKRKDVCRCYNTDGFFMLDHPSLWFLFLFPRFFGLSALDLLWNFHQSKVLSLSILRPYIFEFFMFVTATFSSFYFSFLLLSQGIGLQALISCQPVSCLIFSVFFACFLLFQCDFHFVCCWLATVFFFSLTFFFDKMLIFIFF